MNRIRENPIMRFNMDKYDSNAIALDGLRSKMGYPAAKKGRKS